MPATIRDVARAAGVSITAAHRALNDKAELSPDKRARVLAAARQLNYVPSAAARALVSGKTNTIGMVVTDNASPVYAGIVRGVEEVANTAGFGLLLCNSGDSQERAIACLELLRAKQVDGVLLTPVQTDRRDVARLREIGVPFVLLLRHFAEVESDYVITDNEAGGYAATTHLLDLGHRRIGHVAGPAFVSSARGRLAGYRRALEERGLTAHDDLVAHAPFTVGGGYDHSFALLDRPDRPTAIFAANDLQAVGVMKAARALDLRIPDDLALVGGDDIELAEFLEVPLTTFHQPAREIGSLGAEILLDRLRGDNGEQRGVVLTPRLIVRRSSGCPR
ncbi:MAG: LacI family transcriptional regulator [Thermomicrobiales bacterium]|jgi:DNA-binding LacI/PurR family transcriptional regulator|nr:LacI family transcriptional regulator [Thermomicrobiales bacterium]MEA2528418.1 LacI family transcriptional regulator [Thermomicrobiales bacterium]